MPTTPPTAARGKIDGAKANIDNVWWQLDARGAQHILVANRAPSLTRVDNLNGVALNAIKQTLVSSIDLELAVNTQLYDAYASIEDMVLKPSTYGLSQVTALCLPNNLLADNVSMICRWLRATSTGMLHKRRRLFTRSWLSRSCGK